MCTGEKGLEYVLAALWTKTTDRRCRRVGRHLNASAMRTAMSQAAYTCSQVCSLILPQCHVRFACVRSEMSPWFYRAVHGEMRFASNREALNEHEMRVTKLEKQLMQAKDRQHQWHPDAVKCHRRCAVEHAPT